MRKTLILGLIAIALAAYVYFYEIKGGEQREKQKAIAEKIFHVKKDSINRIEIKSPQNHFLFVKDADGWQIEQPVQTGADESPVNTLLSGVANAKKVRTFSIKPDQRDKFGLGSRAIKIKVMQNDGGRDSLLIGDDTSVGPNIYVSNQDTLVHLTARSLKNNVTKSLFDWRDKKTIHFKKNEIRQFSLKNPFGSFMFEKDGDDWKIVEPIETAGDNATINAILNKLDYGRIKSVVAEDNSRLRRFDLQRPAYEVELFSGPEKAKLSVIFSAVKDNRAYGADAVRPHVFSVDSSFIKPLKKNLFALRDKQILDFDKQSVDRFNLLYESRLLKFVKDTSDVWVTESGRKAKSWKVSSLLTTLKNLKAKRFVKEDPSYLMPYNLVNPEGKIEIFSGAEKIATLDIGRKSGDEVFVRNPMADPVVTIDASKLDDIFPADEDILEAIKEEEATDSE